MTRSFIQFLPEDVQVPIRSEESVLALALRNKIEISHSCGGMGSCTTCRVVIESSPSPLPPRTEIEQEIADMRGFQDNERLACQLPPLAGLVVRVPAGALDPT